MFRFPDKPIEASPDFLVGQHDRAWWAQIKKDGWRQVVDWDGDGSLTISSSSGDTSRAAVPMSDEMRQALTEYVADVAGDTPARFDTEWCARREADRSERVWIFDVHRWRGEDLYRRPCQERMMILASLWPWPHDAARSELDIQFGNWGDPQAINIMPTRNFDYAGLFDLSKNDPACEGIVLKGVQSVINGSIRGLSANRGWIKVKWRSGEAGRTMVA